MSFNRHLSPRKDKRLKQGDNSREGVRSKGLRGEQLAADYLESVGYVIYERNWSCRVGEIDLIAVDGTALVFVEVKSRVDAPGADRYLFETITPHKQRKLRLLAEIFCARYRRFAADFTAVRIDIIGVILRPGGAAPNIRHYRAAI